MAAQQDRTTAGRQVSRGTPVRFRIGFVVVALVAVVGIVAIFTWSSNETRPARE